MADLPNIELEISITTKPAKHISIIHNAFLRAYKGECGTDETPQEFTDRKIEEHIAALVERFHVEDQTAGVERELRKQARAAITSRVRKDKPEAINELGENDPSMIPENENVSAPKHLARSKRRQRK